MTIKKDVSMSQIMKQLIDDKKNKNYTGVPSLCSANPLVIEASLKHAKEHDIDVLIESTANQVNQHGGYMNMTPSDFKEYVYKMADAVGYQRDRICFGGDHLGPLTFTHLNEEEAMKEAKELVKAYAEAGFEKIHLDTSMRVKDDSIDEPLSVETIARRGAELCKVCEEAVTRLNLTKPVYIIGSEVPIPGGAQEEEESITVTSLNDLKNTIETYKRIFSNYGLDDAFNRVIGVVVQPGVEFGEDQVFYYKPEEATHLSQYIKTMDNFVLEGHSTDYQRADDLRNMVDDGVGILKVGPGLTHAAREGLFALSYIEKWLIKEDDQSKFIEVLEDEMIKDPSQWQKHYHGNPEQLKLMRMFSYSDRNRYYMEKPNVTNAIKKLFSNLDSVYIPNYLIKQFMPKQYDKKMLGKEFKQAKDYVIDFVDEVLEVYRYAAKK